MERRQGLLLPSALVPDQYADGVAARLWSLYIGRKNERTTVYKDWLINTLRKHNCNNILDVACGTGIDSAMLVEAGFNVVSTDGSDKMLKYALKERWLRRHDPNYEKWIIDEANWLTLPADLNAFEEADKLPKAGFDCIICLGNSFAHMLDHEGTHANHKLALKNFYTLLRPGGLLIIDHRNYDAMLDSGQAPRGKNVYYQSDHVIDIRCINLYVNGVPTLTTLDYLMDVSSLQTNQRFNATAGTGFETRKETESFQLSYYPHRLASFTELLKEPFGKNAKHQVFGDFVALSQLEHDGPPAYYVHVIEK